MFGGFTILLVFLLVGELVSSLGIIVPGNVTGMILLTIALATGVIKEDRIEKAAQTLLDNLALFFVPPAVGVMLQADLIAGYIPAISVALVFGTGLVLTITGITAQLLLRRSRRWSQP